MISRCYLEITNLCNLNCKFCPKNQRPPKIMSRNEFDILTDKLKNQIRFLYFHLMGEPLLHPELPQFVHIAKQKEFVPIITTNGTLLSTKTAENLINAIPYKIQISLHSHEGNNKNNLTEYIKTVTDFTIKAASKGTIIILRLWNKGGFNNNNKIIIDLLKDYFSDEWTPRIDGWKICTNIYLEFGKMFEWPNNQLNTYCNEKVFCYALRNQIGVLVDGSVVPCCLDHSGDIILGNLLNDSLSNILNSTKAKSIYDAFTQHIAIEPLCQSCGYANSTKNYRSTSSK